MWCSSSFGLNTSILVWRLCVKSSPLDSWILLESLRPADRKEQSWSTLDERADNEQTKTVFRCIDHSWLSESPEDGRPRVSPLLYAHLLSLSDEPPAGVEPKRHRAHSAGGQVFSGVRLHTHRRTLWDRFGNVRALWDRSHRLLGCPEQQPWTVWDEQPHHDHILWPGDEHSSTQECNVFCMKMINTYQKSWQYQIFTEFTHWKKDYVLF